MNDSYRDAVIRRVLTPSDEVHPPADLSDEIHRRLLATPQQQPAIVAGVPWLGRLRAMSPVLLALILLLVALAGIVAGGAVLLLRDPVPHGVFSYRGGPGHTGVLEGPAPVDDAQVAWEAKLPRGLNDSTMPLVADGTVYVVDLRGDAVARSLDSGTERWSEELPTDVAGTPLIATGLLVAPADDGIVRALDLSAGAIEWTADIGARAGASISGWGDLALVGADDGKVHALDVATGVEQWTVEAGGPVVKAPAVEDGIAYAVTQDGPVTAFEATTGEIVWQLTDLGPGEFMTPVVLDGTLYLAHGVDGGTAPYQLIALDVRDRNASVPTTKWRWSPPTSDRLFIGAVTADTVYATSADHNVYAIDSATGTGTLLFQTEGEIGSPTVIVGETLYVPSQDGNVYAIDRTSGDLRWTFPVDGMPAALVAADGRLIVGTDLANLVALVETPTGS